MSARLALQKYAKAVFGVISCSDSSQAFALAAEVQGEASRGLSDELSPAESGSVTSSVVSFGSSRILITPGSSSKRRICSSNSSVVFFGSLSSPAPAWAGNQGVGEGSSAKGSVSASKSANWCCCRMSVISSSMGNDSRSTPICSPCQLFLDRLRCHMEAHLL